MRRFTRDALVMFRQAAVNDGTTLTEQPEGNFILAVTSENLPIDQGVFPSGYALAEHLLASIGCVNCALIQNNSVLSLGAMSPVGVTHDENLLKVTIPWDISVGTRDAIREMLTTIWSGEVVNYDTPTFEVILKEGFWKSNELFRMVATQLVVMAYVEEERLFLAKDHDGDRQVGVQPEGGWPRDEGQNVNDPKRKFLTGSRLAAPPRPESPESYRQIAIHRAMQTAGQDIDVAIGCLSERVEQLPNEKDLADDPAIIALAVLSKTRAAERRRILQRRVNMGVVFCSLVAIIALSIYFGRQMVTSGRNTIVFECSVPYGDDRLTAERFQSYSFKELFGFQQIDKASITEVTKLKLTGDDLIILGVDPKDNKPWRLDFAKGEFGNPPLKPTDLYWFVGGRGKASPVAYKAFCH